VKTKSKKAQAFHQGIIFGDLDEAECDRDLNKEDLVELFEEVAAAMRIRLTLLQLELEREAE
jgi:hypothetical protein